MNPKEIKQIVEIAKRKSPRDHNIVLIERTVRATIDAMESRPWWKRLLKK